MSRAKTAEPIDRDAVLDGNSGVPKKSCRPIRWGVELDPYRGRDTFWRKVAAHCIGTRYRKMCTNG